METGTPSPAAPAVEFKTQPGKQSDFQATSADIALYGGARGGGKTFGVTLEPIRHYQNSLFGALMLRRTMPEVKQKDGLWDTAEKIYPWLGAESVADTWIFPSGATVEYSSMANQDDWRGFLGSQYALIVFDQLETFTEKQFWAMLACNRSMCGIKPYIRATANPETGWLADFISWWWDGKTGYPIMERSGVVRWFVRVQDRVIWSDTREELAVKFPTSSPMSFTFIPAFVEDNPILIEQNPSYIAMLKNQGIVETERWLYGNWKVKVSGGMLLKREWFSKVIEKPEPRYERIMRYWDFAATGEQNPNFDQACYTSGTKMGLLNGVWDILDIRRARLDPPGVEELVRTTAAQDGRHVVIRMEREGGSAGPWVVSHISRNVLVGYDFAEGKEKWHKKDKITRAGFLASAAKNGNVRLLYAGGVKPEWAENFLVDCDNAPDGWMDDIDSTSGAIIEMGGVGASFNPPQRVVNAEAKSGGFDMPQTRRRGVTI